MTCSRSVDHASVAIGIGARHIDENPVYVLSCEKSPVRENSQFQHFVRNPPFQFTPAFLLR